MRKRDFSFFDRRIDGIVEGLDAAGRDAIKNRVNLALDRLETDPGSHELSVRMRERIRETERRALKKLGNLVLEPKRQGRRCSLCEQYESDVGLVPLGDYAVCGECIRTIKAVLDEQGERR